LGVFDERQACWPVRTHEADGFGHSASAAANHELGDAPP
jgi:hypothetical protein